MVVRHLTVGKRAKRMPDITVETTVMSQSELTNKLMDQLLKNLN